MPQPVSGGNEFRLGRHFQLFIAHKEGEIDETRGSSLTQKIF